MSVAGQADQIGTNTSGAARWNSWPVQRMGCRRSSATRLATTSVSGETIRPSRWWTRRATCLLRNFGVSVFSWSPKTGPKQARTDGVPKTTVEVACLAPPTRSMAHVELLRYGGSFDCSTVGLAPSDIAETELVFGSGSLSVGFDGPSALASRSGWSLHRTACRDRPCPENLSRTLFDLSTNEGGPQSRAILNAYTHDCPLRNIARS